MRILLIKGRSLYDGTRMFIDSAASAFAGAGHEVEVLDLGVVDAPSEALAAYAGTCATDLVFSIGITGEFRDEAGRTVSQLYSARHIVWHVDYMLGQGRRIEETPASTGLLFIDPTHIDSLRAAYGPEAHPHMGFFPHPGVGEPAADDPDVDAYIARRPIRLLWSGSFQKAERPWGQFSAIVQKTLNNATDLALSVEWIPPHEAVAQVLREMGIDATEPSRRIHLTLAGHVHDHVRKARRTEFMRAVAKTGVPIHICGLGWEPHLYRFKNVTYDGAVDMTRMVELMRQSRIVLNTNVNFGCGSHERPFSASLAGAATFSDHSGYYDGAFGPGEIAMFRWKDLAAGMAELKGLADDPGRTFEMGRLAKARAVAEHTWSRRIPMILEMAEALPEPPPR